MKHDLVVPFRRLPAHQLIPDIGLHLPRVALRRIAITTDGNPKDSEPREVSDEILGRDTSPAVRYTRTVTMVLRAFFVFNGLDRGVSGGSRQP